MSPCDALYEPAKSGNNGISLLGSCKREKRVESDRAYEGRNEFYPFDVSCHLKNAVSFLTTDWNTI